MPMHPHFKGLHAVLLSVVLAGCSAAPAPCLIQRVLLGGYTMRFDLKGAAPAGCEATLPQTFGDNWTFEAYPDGTVGVTSDRIQNGADPDPSHVGIGKGKLTATEPDAQSFCYVTDVSEMRGDVNPFGLPPAQERRHHLRSQRRSGERTAHRLGHQPRLRGGLPEGAVDHRPAGGRGFRP